MARPSEGLNGWPAGVVPPAPGSALTGAVGLVVEAVEGDQQRRIRLQTLDDVAVEARRLYRDARNGLLDSQRASRLSYILQVVRQTIEAAEIERRLSALEDLARGLVR